MGIPGKQKLPMNRGRKLSQWRQVISAVEREGWYDILEDVLQCPVCLDVVKTKIYQCISGHHICHLCRIKLKICPMCKAEFSRTRNLLVEDVISRLVDIQVAIDYELEAILTKRQAQQRSVSTETDFAENEKEKEKVSRYTQTYTKIHKKFAKNSFPCFVNSCQLSLPFLPLVQHLRERHNHEFCEMRASGNVFSQKCIIDTNVLPKRHDFVIYLKNIGLFFFLVLLESKTNMIAQVIFVHSGVLPSKRFVYELKLENKYFMQKVHNKITLPDQPRCHTNFYTCNFPMNQEDVRQLINGNSFGCTLTVTRHNNEV